MSIIDFFPSYPPIDSENFYQEIYEMKEFNVLAENGIMDGFYHHQLFPARFLAPWTNIYYNSLFLIHDTGTGKSGSIASVLNILKNSNPKQRMLYLTKNDVLIRNFKGELLKLCPYIQKKYEPFKNDDSFRPDTLFKSENIEFMTFTTFANKLNPKKSKTKIKVDYNNAFIVMDEVHQLISENLQNYYTILNFLTELPRKRLLLATATPMKDNLLEVIYLLNLLFPEKDRFQTGDDFVKEYLKVEEKKYLKDYSKDKLYEFTWKSENKEQEFKQKIKGYISVFRQKPDNITIRYEGKQVKPLEYSKIFIDELSDFQTDIYRKAWLKDVKNPNGEDDLDEKDEKDNYSNFYLNSIQASLMVFPDGTYGKDSNHYLKKITINKEKNIKIYDAFNEQFANETGILNVSTNIERLEIIKQYSKIYYEIIKQLLDPANQDKCFYVYSDKINGSGILRLINLLIQYFDFSLFNKNTFDQKPRNRCLFLNEKAGVNVDIMEQLKYFNNPMNKNGEFIRVVFGTDKTREGITLKNIQKIHIITPGWNFGKKNQAEGRGIRLNSHKDLENPSVDIYLHCAVPKIEDTSNEQIFKQSVNFLQYIRSEVKEKNNFLFSYAFLTAAVDCQINYYQNYRQDAKDNSIECYFQKCDYSCDGIIQKYPEKINVSNFNTYYYVYYIPQTISLLSELFEDQKFLTFEQIKFSQYIKKKYNQITDLLLFETLNKIIDEPITIPNAFQIPLYLKRNNDKFFLSSFKNIPTMNGFLTGDQENVPCFKINTNTNLMKLYIFNTFIEEKLTLLKELMEKDIQTARKYFSSFPLHFQTLLNANLPKNFLKKLELSVQTTNEELEQQDLKEKYVTNNNFGFYGILDGSSFKIKNLSVKNKKGVEKIKETGKQCKFTEVFQIIFYIMVLFMREDTTFDHKINTISSLIPETKNFIQAVSKFKNLTNDELNELFQKEKEFKNLFPKDYEFSLEEMRIYLFFNILRQKRTILCSFLLDKMKENDLVIE